MIYVKMDIYILLLSLLFTYLWQGETELVETISRSDSLLNKNVTRKVSQE